MAGLDFLGEPVECNISRREDDTDDITVALFQDQAKTTPADVTGWTANLRISTSRNGTAIATFSGTGIAGGLIPIDMATYAVTAPQDLFYDIRITDTVTPDTPARVYFFGKWKSVERITP